MGENAGTLRECTSKIVASYVQRHVTASEQIPTIITTVYNTLAALGQPVVVETAKEPAVPIRKSVRPDSLVCLECGFKGKMLRRHLRSEHDLTPEAYRVQWNLSPDYPMTAPNYAHERSILAKQIGLGTHRNRALAAQAAQTPVPAEQRRRGRPPIHQETASRGRGRRTAAASTT